MMPERWILTLDFSALVPSCVTVNYSILLSEFTLHVCELKVSDESSSALLHVAPACPLHVHHCFRCALYTLHSFLNLNRLCLPRTHGSLQWIHRFCSPVSVFLTRRLIKCKSALFCMKVANFCPFFLAPSFVICPYCCYLFRSTAQVGCVSLPVQIMNSPQNY